MRRNIFAREDPKIRRALERMDAARAKRIADALAGARARGHETAKQRRIAKAKAARQARVPQRRLTIEGWQAMAARMAPGAWYEFPALVDLMPEFARGSVKAWLHQKLIRGGIVAKAVNPDFDLSKRQEHQTVGRNAYSLTATGADLAAEWRQALREG